jgi:hypothetical protein
MKFANDFVHQYSVSLDLLTNCSTMYLQWSCRFAGSATFQACPTFCTEIIIAACRLSSSSACHDGMKGAALNE